MVAAGFQPASKEDLSPPAQTTKVEKSDFATPSTQGNVRMGTDGYFYKLEKVDGKNQLFLVDCGYNLQHKTSKKYEYVEARIQVECIRDSDSGQLRLAPVDNQQAKITINGEKIDVITSGGKLIPQVTGTEPVLITILGSTVAINKDKQENLTYGGILKNIDISKVKKNIEVKEIIFTLSGMEVIGQTSIGDEKLRFEIPKAGKAEGGTGEISEYGSNVTVEEIEVEKKKYYEITRGEGQSGNLSLSINVNYNKTNKQIIDSMQPLFGKNSDLIVKGFAHINGREVSGHIIINEKGSMEFDAGARMRIGDLEIRTTVDAEGKVNQEMFYKGKELRLQANIGTYALDIEGRWWNLEEGKQVEYKFIKEKLESQTVTLTFDGEGNIRLHDIGEKVTLPNGIKATLKLEKQPDGKWRIVITPVAQKLSFVVGEEAVELDCIAGKDGVKETNTIEGIKYDFEVLSLVPVAGQDFSVKQVIKDLGTVEITYVTDDKGGVKPQSGSTFIHTDPEGRKTTYKITEIKGDKLFYEQTEPAESTTTTSKTEEVAWRKPMPIGYGRPSNVAVALAPIFAASISDTEVKALTSEEMLQAALTLETPEEARTVETKLDEEHKPKAPEVETTVTDVTTKPAEEEIQKQAEIKPVELKPAPIAFELGELIKNNVLKGDGATINLTGACKSYTIATKWDEKRVVIGTIDTGNDKPADIIGAYLNSDTGHLIFIADGEQRIVYKTGDKPSDKVDTCNHTEYKVIKQDGNIFDIDGVVEWSYDLTTKALNHMAFNPGHIFTGGENVNPIDMGQTTPDEVVGGHIYNIKREAVKISDKSEFYSLQNVYYLEGDTEARPYIEKTRIGDKLLLVHRSETGVETVAFDEATLNFFGVDFKVYYAGIVPTREGEKPTYQLLFSLDQEAEVTINGQKRKVSIGSDGRAYINGKPVQFKEMPFNTNNPHNQEEVKTVTAYITGFSAEGGVFGELEGRKGDRFHRMLGEEGSGGTGPEGIASKHLQIRDVDENGDGKAEYQEITLKRDKARLAFVMNVLTGQINYLPFTVGSKDIHIAESSTGVAVPGIMGLVVKGHIDAIGERTVTMGDVEIKIATAEFSSDLKIKDVYGIDGTLSKKESGTAYTPDSTDQEGRMQLFNREFKVHYVEVKAAEDREGAIYQLVFSEGQDMTVVDQAGNDRQVWVDGERRYAYLGSEMGIPEMGMMTNNPDNPAEVLKVTGFIEGFTADGGIFGEIGNAEGKVFYQVTGGGEGGTNPEDITSEHITVEGVDKDADGKQDGKTDYHKITLKSKDARLAFALNPIYGQTSYMPFTVGSKDIDIVESPTGVAVPGYYKGVVLSGHIDEIKGEVHDVDGRKVTIPVLDYKGDLQVRDMSGVEGTLALENGVLQFRPNDKDAVGVQNIYEQEFNIRFKEETPAEKGRRPTYTRVFDQNQTAVLEVTMPVGVDEEGNVKTEKRTVRIGEDGRAYVVGDAIKSDAIPLMTLNPEKSKESIQRTVYITAFSADGSIFGEMEGKEWDRVFVPLGESKGESDTPEGITSSDFTVQGIEYDDKEYLEIILKKDGARIAFSMNVLTGQVQYIPFTEGGRNITVLYTQDGVSVPGIGDVVEGEIDVIENDGNGLVARLKAGTSGTIKYEITGKCSYTVFAPDPGYEHGEIVITFPNGEIENKPQKTIYEEARDILVESKANKNKAEHEFAMYAGWISKKGETEFKWPAKLVQDETLTPLSAAISELENVYKKGKEATPLQLRTAITRVSLCFTKSDINLKQVQNVVAAVNNIFEKTSITFEAQEDVKIGEYSDIKELRAYQQRCREIEARYDNRNAELMEENKRYAQLAGDCDTALSLLSEERVAEANTIHDVISAKLQLEDDRSEADGIRYDLQAYRISEFDKTALTKEQKILAVKMESVYYRDAVGFINEAYEWIHAKDFDYENKDKDAVKGNVLGFKLFYRAASLELEIYEHEMIAEKLKGEIKDPSKDVLAFYNIKKTSSWFGKKFKGNNTKDEIQYRNSIGKERGAVVKYIKALKTALNEIKSVIDRYGDDLGEALKTNPVAHRYAANKLMLSNLITRDAYIKMCYEIDRYDMYWQRIIRGEYVREDSIANITEMPWFEKREAPDFSGLIALLRTAIEADDTKFMTFVGGAIAEPINREYRFAMLGHHYYQMYKVMHMQETKLNKDVKKMADLNYFTPFTEFSSSWRIWAEFTVIRGETPFIKLFMIIPVRLPGITSMATDREKAEAAIEYIEAACTAFLSEFSKGNYDKAFEVHRKNISEGFGVRYTRMQELVETHQHRISCVAIPAQVVFITAAIVTTAAISIPLLVKGGAKLGAKAVCTMFAKYFIVTTAVHYVYEWKAKGAGRFHDPLPSIKFGLICAGLFVSARLVGLGAFTNAGGKEAISAVYGQGVIRGMFRSIPALFTNQTARYVFIQGVAQMANIGLWFNVVGKGISPLVKGLHFGVEKTDAIDNKVHRWIIKRLEEIAQGSPVQSWLMGGMFGAAMYPFAPLLQASQRFWSQRIVNNFSQGVSQPIRQRLALTWFGKVTHAIARPFKFTANAFRHVFKPNSGIGKAVLERTWSIVKEQFVEQPVASFLETRFGINPMAAEMMVEAIPDPGGGCVMPGTNSRMSIQGQAQKKAAYNKAKVNDLLNKSKYTEDGVNKEMQHIFDDISEANRTKHGIETIKDVGELSVAESAELTGADMDYLAMELMSKATPVTIQDLSSCARDAQGNLYEGTNGAIRFAADIGIDGVRASRTVKVERKADKDGNPYFVLTSQDPKSNKTSTIEARTQQKLNYILKQFSKSDMYIIECEMPGGETRQFYTSANSILSIEYKEEKGKIEKGEEWEAGDTIFTRTIAGRHTETMRVEKDGTQHGEILDITDTPFKVEKRFIAEKDPETGQPVIDPETGKVKTVTSYKAKIRENVHLSLEERKQAESVLKKVNKLIKRMENDYFVPRDQEGVNQVEAILATLLEDNTIFRIPTGVGKSTFIFAGMAVLNKELFGIQSAFVLSNDILLKDNADPTGGLVRFLESQGLQVATLTERTDLEGNIISYQDFYQGKKDALERFEAVDVVFMTAYTWQFMLLGDRSIKGTGILGQKKADKRAWDILFNNIKIVHDEVDTVAFISRAQMGMGNKAVGEMEKEISTAVFEFFGNLEYEGKTINELRKTNPEDCHKAYQSLLQVSVIVNGKVEVMSYNTYLGRKRAIDGEVMTMIDVAFNGATMKAFQEWLGEQDEGLKEFFKDGQKLQSKDDFTPQQNEKLHPYRAALHAMQQVASRNLPQDATIDYHPNKKKPSGERVLIACPTSGQVAAPSLHIQNPYEAVFTELVVKEHYKEKAELDYLEISGKSSVTIMAEAIKRARDAGAQFIGFSGTVEAVEDLFWSLYGIKVRPMGTKFNYERRVHVLKTAGSDMDVLKDIIKRKKELKNFLICEGRQIGDLRKFKIALIEQMRDLGFELIMKDDSTGWDSYSENYKDGIKIDYAGKIVVIRNTDGSFKTQTVHVVEDRESDITTIIYTDAKGVKHEHIIEGIKYDRDTMKAEIADFVQAEQNSVVEDVIWSVKDMRKETTPGSKRVFYLNPAATRGVDIIFGADDLEVFVLTDRSTPKSFFEQLAGRTRGLRFNSQEEFDAYLANNRDALDEYLKSKELSPDDYEYALDNDKFFVIRNKATGDVMEKEYHHLTVYVVDAKTTGVKEGGITLDNFRAMLNEAEKEAKKMSLFRNLSDIYDNKPVEILVDLADEVADEKTQYGILMGFANEFQMMSVIADSLSLSRTPETGIKALQERITRAQEFFEMISHDKQRFERLSPAMRAKIKAHFEIKLDLYIRDTLKGKPVGGIAYAESMHELVSLTNNTVVQGDLPTVIPYAGSETQAAVHDNSRAEAEKEMTEQGVAEENQNGLFAALEEEGHVDGDRLSPYAGKMVSSFLNLVSDSTAKALYALRLMLAGARRPPAEEEKDFDRRQEYSIEVIIAMILGDYKGLIAPMRDNFERVKKTFVAIGDLLEQGVIDTAKVGIPDEGPVDTKLFKDFRNKLMNALNSYDMLAVRKLILDYVNESEIGRAWKALEKLELDTESNLEDKQKHKANQSRYYQYHKDDTPAETPVWGLPVRVFRVPIPMVLSMIYRSVGVATYALYGFVGGYLLPRVSYPIIKSYRAVASFVVTWQQQWYAGRLQKKRKAYWDKINNHPLLTGNSVIAAAWQMLTSGDNVTQEQIDNIISRSNIMRDAVPEAKPSEHPPLFRLLLPIINMDRSDEDKFENEADLQKAIEAGTVKITESAKRQLSNLLKAYRIEVSKFKKAIYSLKVKLNMVAAIDQVAQIGLVIMHSTLPGTVAMRQQILAILGAETPAESQEEPAVESEKPQEEPVTKEAEQEIPEPVTIASPEVVLAVLQAFMHLDRMARNHAKALQKHMELPDMKAKIQEIDAELEQMLQSVKQKAGDKVEMIEEMVKSQIEDIRSQRINEIAREAEKDTKSYEQLSDMRKKFVKIWLDFKEKTEADPRLVDMLMSLYRVYENAGSISFNNIKDNMTRNLGQYLDIAVEFANLPVDEKARTEEQKKEYQKIVDRLADSEVEGKG
ncbi:MAG: hypothetical protein OEW69_00965, partial [Nitrospirota bacterium]|nr:hypothetical protein [Nitrospirota bacterium]